MLLSGCKTNSGVNSEFTESVLEHQRRIIELEIELSTLYGRIDSTRERIDDIIDGSEGRINDIRTRATSISDSSERIIYFLDGYDREVRIMLSELNELRSKIKTIEESATSSYNYILD
jgi:predicted  nucleic acid-binding Zn-ribbon protein